ncbi:MAG: hypothetical protein WD226_03575 [Planctomycetota bacterium]
MIPWITGWALSVLAAGGGGSDAAPVSLTEAREFPSAQAGKTLRFVVQFDRLVESWDPLMTRFAPEEWVAFSAWADESFTWEPAVFRRPFARLFVAADSRLVPALERAERFRRFEVEGVCRAVLGGDPWFEVQHLTPLEEFVGEGTLVTIQRASEALQQGRFEIAFDLLERAKLGPLPAHARDGIDRLKASFETERLRWLDRRRASDPARGRILR